MTIYAPVTMIDSNPWQPRTAYDTQGLQELADSIKAHFTTRPETFGLLQVPAARLVDHKDSRPLPVYDSIPANGSLEEWLNYIGARVQIAYGHRRLGAFRLLEQGIFPITLGPFTDEEMATMAWAENSARKDLTAVEEARAVQRMMTDFGWTQEQAANRTGYSRSALANKLRLLALPAEIQAANQEGKLPERTAAALVALYDLPEPLRKRAEKHYMYKPSEITKAALKGQTSDQIRTEIRSLAQYHSVDLSTATWPMDQPVADQPPCKGCQLRLGAGQQVRCGDQDCFKKKQDTWAAGRLAAANAASGIKAEAVVGVQLWNFYRFKGDGQEIVDQVRSGSCENRRLVYAGAPSGSDTEHTLADLGYPDVEMVCARKGSACTCVSAARRGETPEQVDQAEVEKAAAERAAKKAVRELLSNAADRIAAGIADNNEWTWRQLLRHVDYNAGTRGAEWSIEKIQRAIAAKIAENGLSWTAKDKPDEAVAQLDILLRQAGLQPLQQSANPALEDALARWQRIEPWVSDLQHSDNAPTYNQVQGNIDNLARLQKDLAAHHDQVGADVIDAINDWHTRLEELLNAMLLPGWQADQWKQVSGLVVTGGDDSDFKALLERAPAPALAAALALTNGRDGYGVRAGRLRGKLNTHNRNEQYRVRVHINNVVASMPYSETGLTLTAPCICDHSLIEHGPQGCTSCTCEMFEQDAHQVVVEQDTELPVF